jgi:hypothetical protein
MSTRREFLERSTASAALFGTLALPLDLIPVAPLAPAAAGGAQEDWNTRWPARITGKHKALFDATEVESGYGVWRASAWAGQYRQVMKAAITDISPVIVLRHNAIILAMQHSFWARYGIGKSKGVTHPITRRPSIATLRSGRDGWHPRPLQRGGSTSSRPAYPACVTGPGGRQDTGRS